MNLLYTLSRNVLTNLILINYQQDDQIICKYQVSNLKFVQKIAKYHAISRKSWHSD